MGHVLWGVWDNFELVLVIDVPSEFSSGILLSKKLANSLGKCVSKKTDQWLRRLKSHSAHPIVLPTNFPSDLLF